MSHAMLYDTAAWCTVRTTSNVIHIVLCVFCSPPDHDWRDWFAQSSLSFTVRCFQIQKKENENIEEKIDSDHWVFN